MGYSPLGCKESDASECAYIAALTTTEITEDLKGLLKASE